MTERPRCSCQPEQPACCCQRIQPSIEGSQLQKQSTAMQMQKQTQTLRHRTQTELLQLLPSGLRATHLLQSRLQHLKLKRRQLHQLAATQKLPRREQSRCQALRHQ